MKKTKPKTEQSNFRLSAKSLQILDEVSKQEGISKTQVVEACLVQYATKLPGFVQNVRRKILELAVEKLKQDEGELD